MYLIRREGIAKTGQQDEAGKPEDVGCGESEKAGHRQRLCGEQREDIARKRGNKTQRIEERAGIRITIVVQCWEQIREYARNSP
jgi:hypothetical protein